MTYSGIMMLGAQSNNMLGGKRLNNTDQFSGDNFSKVFNTFKRRDDQLSRPLAAEKVRDYSIDTSTPVALSRSNSTAAAYSSLSKTETSLMDEGEESKWNSALQENESDDELSYNEIIALSTQNNVFDLNLFQKLLNQNHLLKSEENNFIGQINLLGQISDQKINDDLNMILNFPVQISSLTSSQIDQNNLNMKNGGEALLNNLSEKLLNLINADSDASFMDFNAQDFGKIFLLFENKISQSGDLQKNIEIRTDNIKVLEFLRENLSILMKEIKNSGIKIDDLNIEEIKIENFSGFEKNLITSKPINNISDSAKSIIQEKIEKDNFNNVLKQKKGIESFKTIGEKGELDLLKDIVKERNGIEILKTNIQNDIDYLSINRLNESVKKEFSTVKDLEKSEKIIDIVIKEVSRNLPKGKTEIEIKLIPEELGKITIKVAMKDGNLNANIEVKNSEVKQILENNIVKMRNDLQENGIHLEKINVFLSDQHQFSDGNGKYFKSNNSNANNMNDQETEDEVEIVKSLGYNTVEYIV